MPSWTLWTLLGILIWSALLAFLVVTFRRLSAVDEAEQPAGRKAQRTRASDLSKAFAESEEAESRKRRAQSSPPG